MIWNNLVLPAKKKEDEKVDKTSFISLTVVPYLEKYDQVENCQQYEED